MTGEFLVQFISKHSVVKKKHNFKQIRNKNIFGKHLHHAFIIIIIIKVFSISAAFR